MYNFHMEIARATRNPLLIRIFEIIMDARARVDWNALKQRTETQEERIALTSLNRGILEALKSRDNVAARKRLHELLARWEIEIVGLPPD